jgi:hypothetical protein
MSHAWVASAAMTQFSKETPDLLGPAERAVADALADAGIGPREGSRCSSATQPRACGTARQ